MLSGSRWKQDIDPVSWSSPFGNTNTLLIKQHQQQLITDNSQHLHRCHLGTGTALHMLYILTLVIHKILYRYCYLHFTDEKSGSEKFTQLVRDRARLDVRSPQA